MTSGHSDLTMLPLIAHSEHVEPRLFVFEPLAAAGLLLAVVLFLRARRTLAWRGRATPRLQTFCFATGLVLLGIATLSGLDALSEHWLVSAHMAQHLLMADIAVPLMLIGVRSPTLQFLWPTPVLVAVAGSATVRRIWAGLTRPAVALSVWLTVLVVWHAPALYEASLVSRPTHVLMHVSFMLGSTLAWWPLLEPTHHRFEGRVWKAIYVVVARTVGGILGIVMIVLPIQLYGRYGNASERYGLTALEDQQIAGAMMMFVDFAIIVIGSLMALACIRDDDEPSSVSAPRSRRQELTPQSETVP